MKKSYIKNIVISIMAAYTLTMAFGFVNINYNGTSDKSDEMKVAYLDKEKSDIAYIAEVLNKLYNNFVSVSRVI